MTGIPAVDPARMRSSPPGHFTSRWGLPEYTDWMDESLSWKESCYIGDWSFLWDRIFTGPGALALLSDLSVNSVANFAIGQSKHAIHCDADGKVIAEGIVTRLGEVSFQMFGRGTFWLDHVSRRDGYDVQSTANDSFNFQVSGPNAIAVVEKASGRDLRDVRFMHNVPLDIAGVRVTALRQGMSGEPGFELQGPADQAAAIYAAIVDAGRDFALRQLGGRAVFINHLEACFPTIITDYMPAIFADDMTDYLAELNSGLDAASATFNIAGSFESADIRDWYRSPVELGWGRNIRFDHDFLGRAALESEVRAPRRVMRTLVWNADDVIGVYGTLFQSGDALRFMDMPRDQRGFMYADRVTLGGRTVGVSTSRGYSYSFRAMLSLVVIDADQAAIGTEVEVVWGNPGERQHGIRATVAPAPYKPDNRRIDLHVLR